jgi:Flp pilus assembly CpaE family ATPase
MDAADRIVIVTQLDVAALKSTQKTLTICRRLGYPEDKLCVTVNRYTPGGIIGRRDAAKVLGRDVYYALPNAYQLSSAALTRGVPVAAVDADADLSRDFLRLAAKLGGSSTSDELQAESSSRLGRLFHRKWRV